MVKKVLVLFIVASLLITLSVASGSFAANKKVTLTLSTWMEPYNQFCQKGFLASFQKKYPNIDLEVQVIPADQYEKIIKTRALSGEAPDIIELQNNATYPLFAKEGYLSDLSKQEFAKKYSVPVMNALSYNGKLYGICLEGNGGGIFYNKAVFDKVGVKAPKTYQEFLAVCEKIKAAGITPIGFSGKDAWTLNWFVNPFINSFVFTANPNFTADRYNGKTTYSKDFKVIYQRIKELVDKGYTNKGALGMDFGQLKQAIADGKIAMTANGDWTIGDINRENSGKNINISYFGVPTDDGKVGMFFTPSSIFTVNAKSKNLDAAMKFIAYQGSVQGSTMWAEFKQCIPGRTDIKNAKLPEGTLLYASSMAKNPVFPEYVYGSMPPSVQQVNEKTMQLIIAGEVNIDQALADMDQNYNKDKGQVSKP